VYSADESAPVDLGEFADHPRLDEHVSVGEDQDVGITVLERRVATAAGAETASRRSTHHLYFRRAGARDERWVTPVVAHGQSSRHRHREALPFEELDGRWLVLVRYTDLERRSVAEQALDLRCRFLGFDDVRDRQRIDAADLIGRRLEVALLRMPGVPPIMAHEDELVPVSPERRQSVGVEAPDDVLVDRARDAAPSSDQVETSFGHQQGTTSEEVRRTMDAAATTPDQKTCRLEQDELSSFADQRSPCEHREQPQVDDMVGAIEIVVVPLGQERCSRMIRQHPQHVAEHRRPVETQHRCVGDCTTFELHVSKLLWRESMTPHQQLDVDAALSLDREIASRTRSGRLVDSTTLTRGRRLPSTANGSTSNARNCSSATRASPCSSICRRSSVR
jgi:hypothetical protein